MSGPGSTMPEGECRGNLGADLWKSLEGISGMQTWTILIVLFLWPIPQRGTSKAKLYVYPESSYTSAFKATFLRACHDVELSETSEEAKYKAEVGSAPNKFTWILRDWRGKALSADERSSMEDAVGTLCDAAKKL